MEWQPIDTAPKDGSVFCAYRNRKGIKEVISCRWSDLDAQYPWQVLCAQYGDNFYPDDDYMKLWQPMPDPPHDLTHR